MRRAVGRILATRTGSAIHRMLIAPLDAPLMRLTRGRVHFAKGTVPLVLLRTTGAKSGAKRDVPLGYFTDGDDVILIASNYGQAKHPNWYHNLLKNPECQLFADGRSDSCGTFLARPTEGAEHERRARGVASPSWRPPTQLRTPRVTSHAPSFTASSTSAISATRPRSGLIVRSITS